MVKDRLFGMATAAAQNEGGIDTNDWEVFTRDAEIGRRVVALLRLGRQPLPRQLEPAGEAVRHGDLEVLKADLDRAQMLGANAFRFSIEWARLEPRLWLRHLRHVYAFCRRRPGERVSRAEVGRVRCHIHRRRVGVAAFTAGAFPPLLLTRVVAAGPLQPQQYIAGRFGAVTALRLTHDHAFEA